MKKNRILFTLAFCIAGIFMQLNGQAQIGRRFPSERKVVTDPVTGTRLTFLTSTPAGDSKIYQTHNQWTSDGRWVIFRSDRVKGEAMAVNEQSGEIVQVSEGGFMGMLNVARKSIGNQMLVDAVSSSIERVQEGGRLGESLADCKR